MFATLALTPSGAFWTRPHLIRATEEEIDAVARRDLPLDRHNEIAEALGLACTELIRAETLGRC
jgi:hypothetical protein